MNIIEKQYQLLMNTSSDINEHLSILKEYASRCKHVTEMGVRKIVSTWALLAGYPHTLLSIDIKHPNDFGANLDEVIAAAKGEVYFTFKLGDTTKIEIEKTDLLFIDTWHCYNQLKIELNTHAEKVNKYIILHDTKTFGIKGEDGGEGILKAITEFLSVHKEWRIKEFYMNNNGLTILSRQK